MSWLLASAISVIMGKEKRVKGKRKKAEETDWEFGHRFSALSPYTFSFFPAAEPPRGERLGTSPWGKASWNFQWRKSPRDGRRFLRWPG